MKIIRNRILFAFTICAAAVAVAAQTNPKIGFVAGQVTEKTTGQPLEKVKVAAGGAEAVTDADGNFRLELPPGIYNLRFQAAGYAEFLTGQITITAGRTLIQNVGLSVTFSERVDIASGAFETTTDQTISQTALNRDEIRNTPGTGGDALRALDSLPSVTSASAEFADLIVRGGTTGENLTFIDNIPAGDFTLFSDKYDGGRGGRGSILTADVIQNAQFSAGGFGVRYGDRMSSALDLTLREAARERFQGVGFVDSGGLGASLETPLGRRGSWLFNFRRSYVDIAFDIARIGDIGRPRNWDFVNKFVYDLNDRNKLSVTALNLFERFTLTDAQSAGAGRRSDRLRTDRRSRRTIFGATLATTVGKSALSQLTGWAVVQHADAGFVRPYTTVVQRLRDLRDAQFGVKEELSAVYSPKLQLAAGGAIVLDQGRYFTFERSGSGFSALEEEYYAPDRTNSVRFGTKLSGYLYGQLTWRPAARLAVTPQLRFDRGGLAGENLLSPRVSVNYRLAKRVALNFAAGIYRQPPTFFEVTQSGLNRALKTQRAVHLIFGAEWLIREDWRLRAEVYRKSYANLIVRPVVADLNYFANTGEGTADGVEIALQKSLSGRFAGQASYSFIRARRRLCAGCVEFPAETERPHQLILIGVTRLAGISLAAKYRLASGLPYTLRTPVRLAASFYLERIASAADLNAGRLPRYSNLDVRAEKKFDFRRWSIAPYIDVFNIFGSRNTTDVTYQFSSSRTLTLGESDRLPIFGLRIEF
ncbi:MAG: TonB-dependent receptor [Acidobacteria bacterium]|nr:TonB-dependent receptor [Acidobacteriota bacterium]